MMNVLQRLLGRPSSDQPADEICQPDTSPKPEPVFEATPEPATPKTAVERALDGLDSDPASCYQRYEALCAAGNRGDVEEFVRRVNFSIFDYLKPREFHDFSPFERESYIRVSNLIAQTPPSGISLLRAVDYIARAGIPGAMVECGVFKGASPTLMAMALLRHGDSSRDIYLFDTFAGMPEPDVIDVDYEGKPFRDEWEPARTDTGSTITNASLEEVRSNVARAGYPAGRFHFVQGMVEDTIPGNAPETIALLRLDTDYYTSTRHELEHLYPRLQPGGVLIIDDYGHFAGARKAVDEYFDERPILLARVTESVRLAVKPHNHAR